MGSPVRARTCKVPQVTWIFWIIKCCATTVGETLSDQFNTGFGLGLGGAAAIFIPTCAALLCLQFYLDRYVPTVYWLCVIWMSISGTIITDGFHDNVGVANYTMVPVFFTLMSATFFFWYRFEGTLNIHSIHTVRREAFYWWAIIWTFALGTAAGDGIATWSMLGFGPILGLFAAIIFVIGVVWYLKLADEVLCFWLAYIMTRPLGASTGDLLAQSRSQGALGLGTGPTSGLFTGIIIILVAYLEWSKVDQLPVEENKVQPGYDEEATTNAAGLHTQVSQEQEIVYRSGGR